MKTKDYINGWRGVLRGNVLMMGWVSLFTDASSEMIYPLLPVFFTGLVSPGAAAVYLGLMEGIAESTASLTKILSGRWSDASGKRKFFALLGYGLSALCRPCMGLATGAWHMVTLRFLDRIGKGIRTSPRDALISDSVGATHRGLAFSFHRAMDHIGAVLGPMAAIAVLYPMLGYALWQGTSPAATPDEMHAMRILFLLALVPGLAAMFTLAAKVREVGPKTAAAGAHVQPGQGVTLPRRFYVFLAAVTLFALGNSSDLFLVFYAKARFGLGLLHVIGLWIVLHLAKIALSLPGGAIADLIGRRAAILAGWVIYAFVYLGMAFVASPWMLWALIFLYGAYYGMTEGAEKALVSDYVPSEYRGRAFGLYHGVVGLAALPASLLFGVFWAALGPARAFGIGAALAGLAVLVLLRLVVAPLPAAERQPG